MALHPLPSNITGFAVTARYLNTVTGDIFGFMIPISLFFIIFIALKNYTTERAFVTSSFITMLACIFLKVVNIIGNSELFLFVILTAISVVFLYIHTDREI